MVVGVAEGDEGGDFLAAGEGEVFTGFLFVEPSDPACTNSLFGGLKDEVFACDADVEQIILRALDAGTEFVGEDVGLGGDDGHCGGVFGEFAEAVDPAESSFAEVGDLVAVVDDYEAPGLDVFGGGGEPGGFDTEIDFIAFNRFGEIFAHTATVFD